MERYKRRVRQEDRRAGEIIALLFNANRDPKLAEAIDWTDVFTEWKEIQKAQTEDEMFNAMQMWAKQTEGLSS